MDLTQGKRQYIVKLSQPELVHLCTLIKQNADKGDYYGNALNYWKRSTRIVTKLGQASPILKGRLQGKVKA